MNGGGHTEGVKITSNVGAQQTRIPLHSPSAPEMSLDKDGSSNHLELSVKENEDNMNDDRQSSFNSSSRRSGDTTDGRSATQNPRYGAIGSDASSAGGAHTGGASKDPKYSELLALQNIDDQSTELQREGRYAEALECMEKGLVLRQHFFGSNSDEVWKACKTVGEMCNLLAMSYLQQDDFSTVFELLKKAEILSEHDPPGRAVTLNNLACFYRRQGNLHGALKNLQNAISIEEELIDLPNRADTHLNMCAVLSQLGSHLAALEHAQSALILLHEELFVTGSSDSQSNHLEEKADRVAVLAIAYHNVGVEHEFLKRTNLAIQSYQKGVEIATQHLGDSHGIVITLKNSLMAAKKTARKGKLQISDPQRLHLNKETSSAKLRRNKSSSRVGIQG